MSTTRAMKVTNDVTEIRRWVESKGGRPAHVRGSGRGEDPGVLRIDFPGTLSLGSLERMSWADWAKWFDKKQLALVFQPSTRFSRIVPAGEVNLTPSTSATTKRAGEAKRATGLSVTRTGVKKKATTSKAPAKTKAKTKRVGQSPALVAKPRKTTSKTPTKTTKKATKRTSARRKSARRG